MFQRFVNSLALISFICVLILSYHHFTSRKEIVYVDSAKLIEGHLGMQSIRSMLEKKSLTYKANIDTLSRDIEQRIFALEKKDQMPPKERELTRELIAIKQKQLRDYQNAVNKQLQEEEDRLTNEVLVTINRQLKNFGKRNNYKIIMAATAYGNIAYAEDGLDVTEMVLLELNSNQRTE